MSTQVRRAAYYYVTAADRPGSAYEVLNELARAEINLMAMSIIPTGPTAIQVTLFPEDPERFERVARKMRLDLSPPHSALLVQGDDEIGALVDIHRSLFDASINVYASQGASNGRGGFGYVVYVKPDDFERAAAVLGV